MERESPSPTGSGMKNGNKNQGRRWGIIPHLFSAIATCCSLVATNANASVLLFDCTLVSRKSYYSQFIPSLSKFRTTLSTGAMANVSDPQHGGAPEAAESEAEELYSVWALPPPDLRDIVKPVMSSLSQEFGGPVFEPHITVVGAILLSRSEALRRLRSAAAGLRPYSARVDAVSRGTFFYQCVYFLINPTPEVMQASDKLCNHFGYKRSTPYMPHMSLLYADLSDKEKEKARKRAEELAKGILGITFEVSEIALYKTDTQDKSLESWELVEVCDLRNDK